VGTAGKLGLATKGKTKPRTRLEASLIPDYRKKWEHNNSIIDTLLSLPTLSRPFKLLYKQNKKQALVQVMCAH